MTSSISSNIDESRRKKKKKLLFVLSVSIIIVILTIIIVAFHFNLVNMIIGQIQQHKKKQGPSLQIPYNSLKVELVTEGLSFPTSMDFIDSNNILVLQKDTGTVHLCLKWYSTEEASVESTS